MNADILFSSHLLGGRITSLTLFFFSAYLSLWELFFSEQVGKKERERLWEWSNFSFGQPVGKVTQGSFLKIQISLLQTFCKNLWKWIQCCVFLRRDSSLTSIEKLCSTHMLSRMIAKKTQKYLGNDALYIPLYKLCGLYEHMLLWKHLFSSV